MARTGSGYTPIQQPGFSGGLNLRDQPNQVDPRMAIDLLNVTFSENGAVKSRDGYTNFTSSTITNQPDSMAPFYTTGGTKQLVVGDGNRLDVITTAGAVLASSTLPTANPHFFARFGGATSTGIMYCANGADSMRTWDGAAFAAPGYTGTAPTGKFVGVTPYDNRLVNARRTGTVAGDNPSTVRFSDAGVPNTWGANNYVDLTPGDGEAIQGVVSFRNYLLVFKESKFFRFYGTTTDGSGNPVFRYEAVDTGIGMCSPKAVCVTRDGVYFLNQRGVYRTTGDAPVLVSGVLDPFFYNTAPDYYLGQSFNHAQLTLPAMTWHREQVYLSVPTGSSTTSNRMLVFDPRFDWWTLYDIPASALASFRIGDNPELVFGYATGSKHVGRHSSSYTTDAGTAITSRARFAPTDFGLPVGKTVREVKVWGKGKVRVGVGANFVGATQASAITFGGSTDIWGDGTGSDLWGDGTTSDTWGSGSSVMPAMARNQVRGTMFSLELANTDSTAWTVYRLTYHLRGRRVPSVLKTES